MSTDISEWLKALGLGRYAQLFTENQVDFDTLRILTEKDLQELGLPFGPRKKLLHAIAALHEPASAAPAAAVPPSPPSPARSTREGERRQATVLFSDLSGYPGLNICQATPA